MSKLDIYKNGNYGHETLSNLVEQFGIHADNEGQRGFLRMARIGADVWQSIFLNKLRGYKEKLLKIDLSTNTIAMPIDCVRVIGVDWVDCDGKKHYMAYDGDTNTEKIEVPITSRCGCQKCNCDSMACSSFASNTYTEEDVMISPMHQEPFEADLTALAGEVYKRVIKMRVLPNGDMIKEITEPYAVVVDNVAQVAYRTSTHLVENLELKECGCVANTPANQKKCFDYCGFPLTAAASCSSEECFRWVKPEGKWKADDDRKIIYVWDCTALTAVVKYVSNGIDKCSEILIPEYAKDALYTGMFHYSIRFKMNVGPYEKIRAKQSFDDECMELVKFLNPIDFKAVKERQDHFAKW